MKKMVIVLGKLWLSATGEFVVASNEPIEIDLPEAHFALLEEIGAIKIVPKPSDGLKTGSKGPVQPPLPLTPKE